MLGRLHAVDVVVLGAGAAGLFCAFEAARRGRRVLLLDHAERPGRKILISGGGRCNFTNTGTRAENFLGENPHFARSALVRFTPADMIALVERHGIPFHEKTLGQLFCDDSAHRILAMLERECGEAAVDLRCGVRVLEVRQSDALASSHLDTGPTPAANPQAGPAQAGAGPRAPRFRIETSAGAFSCRTLVIATGGLSIPKMGATGLGYDTARQFGHRVVEPRPALVPLVLAPDDLAAWSDLAGVSTEVTAEALPSATTHPENKPDRSQATAVETVRSSNIRSRAKRLPLFREKLLITHRGLSGPAILQVSSYWHPGAEVQIDLGPARIVFGQLRARSSGRDRTAAVAALKSVLPARFAERWVDLQLRPRADWSNAGLDRLEAGLHAWRLRPAGTEGFGKAEVTAGGVDVRELHAGTMESLRVPGLHFIGEVVDITGWLGGYNFQWAWASAAACGRNL